MKRTPKHEIYREEYEHFRGLLGPYWAVIRLAEAYGVQPSSMSETLRRAGAKAPRITHGRAA